MMEESRFNSDVKAELKKRAEQEELALQAEGAARQKREDARRAKALADKHAKYESIGKQWETQGAGREQAEAEKKVMAIIAKEAKLKEDRDDARHRRDNEKIQEGKQLFHK
jgi:hypothetical protein